MFSRGKVPVFCTAVALLACATSTTWARELTASEALDLLDGSLQAIKSFDVQVEATTRLFIITEGSGKTTPRGKELTITRRRKLFPNESPNSSRKRFRQVLQRGKGRIEFLNDPHGVPTGVLVYDEETEKTWNPSQRSASIDHPRLAPVMDGMDYRESYRNVVGRASLMKCLRERKNVKLAAQGPGSPLLVLETAPAPTAKIDFPLWGLRVTIDSRRGFMPVVVEMSRQVGDKPFTFSRREVSAWKDVGGGVWVPTKVITQHFDDDPNWKDTFGQLHSEVLMQVDLARSSWNKHISEDTFILPLPAGAAVSDFTREVKYITGKPDLGTNLEDLAAHARDLIPLHTGPPPSTGSSRRLLIIGASVVFLALAALAIFALRLAKRKLRR